MEEPEAQRLCKTALHRIFKQLVVTVRKARQMQDSDRIPKIGLALGSGASRGWSHLGVIRALVREGIEPDVICGTSVGAMVGGSYTTGKLDALEDWVLDSNFADLLGFFSVRMPQTAFVDIEKLDWFLDNYVAGKETLIESLERPFAANCTDFDNGYEVILREGKMSDAVRASMAMPGLFPAVRVGEQWLIDGGLVNPVPVSTCRSLGADIVIGVNLNTEILQRHNRMPSRGSVAKNESMFGSLKKRSHVYAKFLAADSDPADKAPSLITSIAKAVSIFQDQITRSRLESDPADIMIAPKVGNIGMLEFHRADDAIKEGHAKALDAVDEIRNCILRHKKC